MIKLVKLQLIGPFVLVITITAAEVAACVLAWEPSSATAWYLNINLFGIFQRSHYMLSGHFNIPYFQLLFVAVPILLLACAGLACHRSLLISISSNLSFVYAMFLSYAWYLIETPSLQAASLAGSEYYRALRWSALSLSAGPNVYVLAALFIASLLSFSASHLFYLHAMRDG